MWEGMWTTVTLEQKVRDWQKGTLLVIGTGDVVALDL